MDKGIILIGEFLVNYWIYSSLFIGVTLIAFKFNWLSSDTRGEYISRFALFAGIISASLFISDFRFISQTEKAVTLQWNIEQNQQRDNKPKNSSTSGLNKIAPQFTEHNFGEATNKAPSITPQVDRATQAQVNMDSANSDLSKSDLSNSALSNSNLSIPNLSDIRLFINQQYITQLIVFVWALVALGALSFRLLKLVKLHHFLGKRNQVTDLKTLEILTSLKSARFNDLILSESTALNSPILLSGKEIVLPKNFSQHFKTQQVEAALAHELAHLVRKDNLWLKFYAFIQAILFIQPLNKILIKQLYQIAEQQSDKLAAKWTGNPRALAEALAITAQNQINSSQSFNSSQIEWVPAMKSNKSNLLTRVEGLLGKSQQPSSLLSVFLGAFLSVAVLLTLPGLSIQSVQAKTNIQRGDSHVSIENGRVTQMKVSHRNDDLKMSIEAELEGEIQFNDEETEILKFPEDSRLEIEVDDGDERKIVIERDGDSAIKYSYYQDGRKRPFDPAAKQWFASILPTFFRVTGINAQERVARIKAKSGNKGVLDEVALIDGDYIQRLYMITLFESSTLSNRNITRSISLSENLGSDFEQTTVLKSLLKTQEFNDEELWRQFFSASKKVGSDFEMANLLKVAASKIPADNAINNAFFNASESIGSDFEMRGLFSHVLRQQAVDSRMLIAMFNAAKDIGSDFEAASLLLEARDKIGTDPDVFAAYLSLADGIGSDFEMRRAFSAIISNDLHREHLLKLLAKASDDIGSDFELASLLIEVISNVTVDEELKQAISQAAETIGSNFEQDRVFRKLRNS